MKQTLSIVVLLMVLIGMPQSAYADELKFEAELSGAEEVPPVATEGKGEAEFESDGTGVRFELEWEDLSTPAIMAHVHCGEVGKNGPVGVTLFVGPMGTEGKVTGTFIGPDPRNGCGWTDLSDVMDAMASGGAYVNVHTTQHTGGEIRGQVVED